MLVSKRCNASPTQSGDQRHLFHLVQLTTSFQGNSHPNRRQHQQFGNLEPLHLFKVPRCLPLLKKEGRMVSLGTKQTTSLGVSLERARHKSMDRQAFYLKFSSIGTPSHLAHDGRLVILGPSCKLRAQYGTDAVQHNPRDPLRRHSNQESPWPIPVFGASVRPVL